MVDGLIKAVYASSQGDTSPDDVEKRLLKGVRDAEQGAKATPVSDFLAELGSRTDGDTDRNALISNGLRNVIVSRRNAPTKISPANNALRLTDIQPIHDLSAPSSFRAAEELFEIEAFNGENFISIEGVDQITAWSKDQAEQVSGRWKARQDILRGTSLGGNRPVAENSIEAVVDGFNQAVDNANTRADRISDLFNNIGEDD